MCGNMAGSVRWAIGVVLVPVHTTGEGEPVDGGGVVMCACHPMEKQSESRGGGKTNKSNPDKNRDARLLRDAATPVCSINSEINTKSFCHWPIFLFPQPCNP